MRTLLAALVIAAPVLAQPPKMLPRTMEVGKVGELWPDTRSAPGGSGVVNYIITEVGADWIAVRVETQEIEGDRMTVLIRGIDTKGMVDGRNWKPAGTWVVEKTEKYKGRTVFALKPHDKKDKK